MPRRPDIVCLGSQDWHTHLATPQQTMGRLARQHRVLYVGYPRSCFNPAAGRGTETEDVAEPRDRLRRVGFPGARLHVFDPPARLLPANRVPEPAGRVAAALNGRILARMVRRAMARIGLESPLLWIYLPTAHRAIPHLPSRLVIYDCVDQWEGYQRSERARRSLRRADRELCERADLVFVGSRALLERKASLNPRTFLVPHAADYALFRRATEPETPIPPELEALPHPRVGLLGVLEKRVDWGLLDQLAGAHPEWSIVLVGPLLVDPGALARRPNVHFLGMQPVEALPGYLKGLDACLLPYVIDDFTRAIYPLKLHEYLASGKPVVSTRIPACEEFAPSVSIADGPDAFRAALEAALAEDDPEACAKRRSIAAAHTWEARVAEKSRCVDALLHGEEP